MEVPCAKWQEKLPDIVNMPMVLFVFAAMPGDPRFNTTGTKCTANVDVESPFELDSIPATDLHALSSITAKYQYIGSGICVHAC